jgi:hypothetical protein
MIFASLLHKTCKTQGAKILYAPGTKVRIYSSEMLGCFRKWFGGDGEIISHPDPCRLVPFRPPVFDEVNPMLDAEYKLVNICVCLCMYLCIYVQKVLVSEFI